jgi:hypothetical protein
LVAQAEGEVVEAPGGSGVVGVLVDLWAPWCWPAATGAWYREWRLVALDATTLDVPDTPWDEEAKCFL